MSIYTGFGLLEKNPVDSTAVKKPSRTVCWDTLDSPLPPWEMGLVTHAGMSAAAYNYLAARFRERRKRRSSAARKRAKMVLSSKMAVWILVLFLSTPLLSGDQTTIPGADPCKTATPQAGCYKVITPPRLLNLVRPDYPKRGWKKKHGQVRLKTTIATTGELKDLKVLSGPDELKKTVLDSVRQWHYLPSTINGVPVEAQHEITVDFTKEDGVLLGADDVPSDLPMQPLEDLVNLLHTGEVQRVGGAVKPPHAIFVPDPSYSALARRNKYQGKCLLSMVITAEGRTNDIWVARPFGAGLDELAIAAVTRWKFDPATKDGKPVAVIANVEVQFRLY